MRKFNVNVNGEAFEVEIEEVGGAPSSAAAPAAPRVEAAPAAPKAAAPKAEEPKPAPKPVKKSGGGSGTPLTAPLPGTVLDVKVKEGQTVKYADVVAVIEAMKMQNDIPAGADGTVTSIQVSKGDSVQAGDVLMYIG